MRQPANGLDDNKFIYFFEGGLYITKESKRAGYKRQQAD